MSELCDFMVEFDGNVSRSLQETRVTVVGKRKRKKHMADLRHKQLELGTGGSCTPVGGAIRIQDPEPPVTRKKAIEASETFFQLADSDLSTGEEYVKASVERENGVTDSKMDELDDGISSTRWLECESEEMVRIALEDALDEIEMLKVELESEKVEQAQKVEQLEAQRTRILKHIPIGELGIVANTRSGIRRERQRKRFTEMGNHEFGVYFGKIIRAFDGRWGEGAGCDFLRRAHTKIVDEEGRIEVSKIGRLECLINFLSSGLTYASWETFRRDCASFKAITIGIQR